MAGAAKTLTLELVGKNSNLSRVLDDSGSKVDAFQRKVEKSNRSLSLSKAAVAGTVAGVTALAAGLSYAVQKAVAFDKAMRNVNSLSKLNEQQFKGLEKQVISMSTKLPQSATTLAEGLYDIASSGFQGADGVKVLDAAARSASAGLTTTETSARAITGVLNAYGLKAKDAADVSDVLFSTVNLGVISFDELANNLGDVVGAAASAKVGIDEVGAAIATMTLSGIKGAQATTSLSSLTTKLVQPSAALAKLYDQLGYKSGAAALETKGLHGVMEDLRKATGGNITSLLQLFPDIEAARGAMALMANEGQNYNKVADQITDKTKRMGATQKVLDEQMKSVSAQWQLLQNRVDAAATTVGVALLPYLLKGLQGVQDFGGAVVRMAQDLESKASPGLHDLGQAAGDVVGFLKELGSAALEIGAPIAKAVGGEVLADFNQLAHVLAEVTQFAADNKEVVIALGAAYAVQAAGGITGLLNVLGKVGPGFAAIRTGGAAAYDFIGGLFTPRIDGAADSVSKLGDKAQAAGKKAGAFVQAYAPAAAIGGALAVATLAWSNYTEGAQEGADVTKRAEAAMNTFNIDEMVKSVQDANSFISDTNKRLEEFAGEKHIGLRFDDIKKFFDVTKNYKTLGMVNELENVQKASYDTQLALSNMQHNTLELFKIMGKPTPDAGKWINDIEGANGVKAQTAAMAQMKEVLNQLGPALEAAGVDMTKGWDTQQMTNAYAALQKVKDGAASSAGPTQQLAEAMKATSTEMGDAASSADKLKAALDGLTGAAIGVDQAQIAWLNGLSQLKTTLDSNGATISLNTQKGRDNRTAVIGQVQALQDLLVASANAGSGQQELTGKLASGRASLIATGVAAGIPRKAMEALLTQYKLTPELVQTLIKQSGAEDAKSKMQDVGKAADNLNKKKPTPKVNAETSLAQSRLNSVQSRLDAIDGRNANASVTVTNTTVNRVISERVTRGQTTAVTGGHAINADGGFYPNGQFLGSYADGMMPTQAVIKSGRAGGWVQWAESETDGEAYIPLSKSKRARSMAILGEVADRFGLTLLEEYANGGFRYPPFKYPAFRYDPKAGARSQQSRQYLADKAAKYREYENARYQAYEEYLDRSRLAQTAAGRRGEGMFMPGMDAGSTFGNLSSALEARAQASAELRARTSRSPSDTAEDYYKKPIISLKQYMQVLRTATTYQRQWNTTLRTLSDKVGSDVVDTLSAMGEEGEAVIKKMATASVKDMKTMAAQIRAMNFAKFFTDTAAEVKGQAQFQANLAALVKMGRADLAQRFQEMGYEQGAGLAAQAVKSPGSTLTQLNNMLAQQEAYNDPQLGEAYKLAAMIQNSGGKLGVVGLSNNSGMSLGDVLGLLQKFDGAVFSKIPVAAMKGIRTDQALLKAGKQPTGHAMGAILRGTETGYFWGEPDSGGESLIPHGIDRRQRALQLWRDTGRILGASAMPGGGAVVVSPGAVQVQVTVTKAGASVRDIEQAATRVVNGSMNELVRQLTTGRRG